MAAECETKFLFLGPVFASNPVLGADGTFTQINPFRGVWSDSRPSLAKRLGLQLPLLNDLTKDGLGIVVGTTPFSIFTGLFCGVLPMLQGDAA